MAWPVGPSCKNQHKPRIPDFPSPTHFRRERRKNPLPLDFSPSQSESQRFFFPPESSLSHSNGRIASSTCCRDRRVFIVYIRISTVRAAIGSHEMHRGRHKIQRHDRRKIQPRQPQRRPAHAQFSQIDRPGTLNFSKFFYPKDEFEVFLFIHRYNYWI